MGLRKNSSSAVQLLFMYQATAKSTTHMATSVVSSCDALHLPLLIDMLNNFIFNPHTHFTN
jgi:hypothetical protein